MNILSSLIWDRDNADSARVEELKAIGVDNMTPAELAEWETDLKGAYNASDVLRVINAELYLQGELASDFGIIITLETAIFSAADELFYAEDEGVLEDYVNNVSTIRGVIAVFPDTPATPASFQDPTIAGANAIEKILYDVSVLLQNTENAWYFSNDIYCGEV